MRPGSLMRFDSFKGRLTAGLLCVVSFALSGCILNAIYPPEPYPLVHKDDFKRETALLEKDLAVSQSRWDRATLLVRLAMLCSHPDNPHPDYKRAAEYLDEYARTGRPVDAAYASALIKQIVILLQDNARLRQQAGELAGKNRECRDIIERLKRLDIRLEKKRKNH